MENLSTLQEACTLRNIRVYGMRLYFRGAKMDGGLAVCAGCELKMPASCFI